MDLLPVRDSSWDPVPSSHSHLVPLLIIGQDLGHIPVPRGDGLDVVIAAVGLKYRQDVRRRCWATALVSHSGACQDEAISNPFLLLFCVAWLELSIVCDGL